MSVKLKAGSDFRGKTIYTARITKNIGFIMHCGNCGKRTLTAGSLMIFHQANGRTFATRSTKNKIKEDTVYEATIKLQQALEDIRKSLEHVITHEVHFGNHDRCMYCGCKPPWIAITQKSAKARFALLILCIVLFVAFIISVYLGRNSDAAAPFVVGILIAIVMIPVLRVAIRLVACKKITKQVELMEKKPILIPDLDQSLADLRARQRQQEAADK